MNVIKKIHNKVRSFYLENPYNRLIKECDVYHINEKDIALTIVITANDRAEQTYFSLKSWDYIAKKNNVFFQVVIVEDTKYNDKRINPLKLYYENLEITYIYIRNKKWVNPCLNYNIGFYFIKSEKIVITNAETCIFGDIYSVIKDKLHENNYLVFDVFNMGNKWHTNMNKEIWDSCKDFEYDTIFNFIKNKNIQWLQSKNRNRQLHFLTCIHKKSLAKLKGFDDEFIFGVCWDDDIFLLQIKNYLKLNVHNIHTSVVGLHQWHQSYVIQDYMKEEGYIGNNDNLYDLKNKYLSKTGKYLYLKDFETFEDLLKEYKDI
jgi:hypothetical protein